MKKIALLAFFALAAALSLFGQKSPESELGFQPGKLYDFSEIDSVNLYNGNLMLTVPIGMRKQVSPTLSYQIQLIYNGKVWDFETFECDDGVCEESMPNRRSNAGLGWRVSFGRLLPPFEATNPKSSDDRRGFVYESPAGDEHPFEASATIDSGVQVATDSSSLRLIRVEEFVPKHNVIARICHVEFPSGEVHRFEWENDAYRLKRISDRFQNSIQFTYEYDSTDPRRVRRQTITDSTLTGNLQGHAIQYQTYTELHESVDRGAVVDYIDFRGLGGQSVRYEFSYETMSVQLFRKNRGQRALLPMLTDVLQPDGTRFRFNYYSDPTNDEEPVQQGALAGIELPTGGKTEYHYQRYALPHHQKPCLSHERNGEAGIKRRTISDGNPLTVRTWDYVQTAGSIVPVDYPDPQGDYCCVGLDHPSVPVWGPVYWVRTSVLSPKEIVQGKELRTRTDHYFDAYSFDFTPEPGCSIAFDPPSPKDPWAPAPNPGDWDLWDATSGTFGYPGTLAAPPPAARQGALPSKVCHPWDGCIPDEYSVDDEGHRLTTEVYSGCTTGGDCTGGKLERSTHTTYEPHPLSSLRVGYPPRPSMRLKASKTVFHESDDAGCNGDCFVASKSEDDNGTGLYGKVIQTSNFPGAKTKTLTTGYTLWSTSDVFNKEKKWITGLYSERSSQEGTETRRVLSCFDAATGFLERKRVLANGDTPGKSDLLTIFDPSSLGDVAFIKSYGGDKQATLPETHDCASSVSALGTPWYKVENHYFTPAGGGTERYTGGILVWSRYYDRETGGPLGFKAVDRTIDTFTGAVLETRDTAGVKTTYQYEATPVRLKSVKPAAGATSSYEYWNATASKNAHVIETVTGPAGVIATNTFEFDGLGRVKRASRTLPNGNVAVVQTNYDTVGRTGSVTQPVESEGHPFGDIGGNATSFTYDALDRQTSVRAADGSTTAFEYFGVRKKRRTSQVATSLGGTSPAVVTELYDDEGRLESVEEESGPGGVKVVTNHTYDIGGNLTSVATTSGGVTQTRTFEYDARGFLEKENHPETQDPKTSGDDYTEYDDYDASGKAWKRTIGGTTLNFEFDSAGRLLEVAGPDGPIKRFEFGDTHLADNGKLAKTVRHNELTRAGNVDVTETYRYGANGQVSSRKTLVERITKVNGIETRTPIQEFDYAVTYDDHLMPRTIRMPRCTYYGCSVDGGLETVTNKRTAGYLTEVEGFATLTHHPSGMVESVRHQTPGEPTDTYSARFGLPRPSRVTFSGCTSSRPSFLPGFVRPKVDPNACGIQITWPAATSCGGSTSIKYRVLRDGVDITGASCLTATKFLDRTAVKDNTYLYSVVAEGTNIEGGTGDCQGGQTTQLAAKAFEFAACDGETQLTLEKVRASVGVPARFEARLASANGPLVDEELTFSVLGSLIGTARTGPTGVAVLQREIAMDPGTHEDGVAVTYAGGLFSGKTVAAELTIVCDFASYSVKPSTLNVLPAGGIFPVVVNTSRRCSWTPIPASGFLLGRVEPTILQEGYGLFLIEVPTLEGAADRASTVRVGFDVGFQNVTVEQGSDCTFRFSPSLAYLPFKSNLTTSMDISAPEGCAWTVTSDSSWLSLEQSTGTGNGSITFRADPNNGKQRVATLSLNGGVETAAVNQYAPPAVICPVLVEDLTRSGSVENGQNISLRVHVEGTYLNYKWYANGSRIRDCEGEHCGALILGPGDTGYPSAGQTSTFQVVVENSCDGVVSSVVSWTNDAGSCKVAIIRDSLFRTNGWPADQTSPYPGSTVRISAVADNWPGSQTELRYQWYGGMAGDENHPIAASDGGETNEISVSPRQTSFYWLAVTNACGTQISRTAAVYVTQPPAIKRRAVRKDFTGDGRSDLLWQNVATGQNEIWKMTGTNHTGTIALPSSSSSNARLQSVGDLDGDERPDLIWRDPQTGQNEVWLMNGSTRRTVAPLAQRFDSHWTIGAVADLDNDFNDDLIWNNSVTGENEIWFQAGTAHEGTWALPSNTGPGWGLHGTDDFNGDGKPDLFFHDRTTGQNSIWLMNDAERSFEAGTNSDGSTSSSTRRLKASIQPMEAMSDTSWLPALVADMDGDDKPDIVWRNVATGENKVWLMSGTSVSQTIALEARTDLNWQIGGGGSTNAGTPGGTTDPRTATSINVAADPARIGTATAVTATLTTGSTPVAQRQLVFSLNGNEAARLLTDAAGRATAALSVSGLAAGTTPNAIAVRFDGDNSYIGSSASADLVITAAPAIVTWLNPAPIVYGTPLGAAQLNATAGVPGTFVYSPAAAAILNAGYQTLSVTFTPSDTTIAPITQNALLIVNKAASSVSWPAPAPVTYGVPLSDLQLNATSSLPGELTYDPESGTLLPVGTGQTLRVTLAPESANYATSAATTTIDVTKGSQIIHWNDPPQMSLGDPLTAAQLNATVIPSGSAPAGAITYDPSAGTILPEGVHELKVSVAETELYLPATATLDVVVSRSTPQIAWSDPAPITYGTALSATQLNATASVPGTFTYTPPAGTILSAGTEKLAVVFTPAGSRYQTATAFAIITIGKATPVVTWSAPAPIVYGTPLSATQLDASVNSIIGEFAYTPKAGTVLDAGTRELTALFIPGDIRNYEHVTMKVPLEVTKASQTIVWPQPAGIVYGTPLSAAELNATVQVAGPSPAGAITYSPAAGTVLQAGPGQLLSASVAATANYNAASASVTIDVLKATPVLTWPQPAPIVYRTLLSPAQLNATANVPGAFVYSPPAGTLLEAGMHALTAQFTPADTANYNDAGATTQLEVQRANPVLAWTRPAGIVYGTPLSPAQLNAAADVPGTFVYTPAAGTILDAGDGQTLKAYFTPSDTRNYNEGDVSTTINVAKAPQQIVWSVPAPIVYGTPLSAMQLNATVEVVGPAPAGWLTYTPPAGKVLDAGLGQTFSVAVAETANYLPNTATVTLDVLRAPLSLTADAKSKLYGDAVPLLTGVLGGVVNSDPITPSYATTATQQSVTGSYPITATLADPNNRLVNYEVTITPSTLTVHPAPLTIAANPASKQYSDPLPELTATFTGLVLGETPAVLSGVLSIQTTAERLSAPGTYPITIGGLASTNYAITYLGSTFTVTPEDARVTITSPLLAGGARTGPTSVILAATVQDISATADAAGDVDAGDIRKATLTFVDRATNTTLCAAPIALLIDTDERTGIATCTFTRDFGATLPATLTAGARVGGYYARDAAADDAALTIATPTGDSITGGGSVEVATAAGSFAPQSGTRLRFNVNLQYDRNAALKGNLTFTFTRTEAEVVRQYELTAAAGSMSILRTTEGGVAAIAGTGTLRDLTDRATPVVIVDGAPLIVTATDAGEPSINDGLSIVLFKHEGGLWLATGWNGLRAVEQPLREGNLSVHREKQP